MLQQPLDRHHEAAHTAPLFDAESFFIDNLGRTRSVLSDVCRRHAGPGDDAEDFCSEAILKMMESDFAVIRKFRSDSSYETYLRRVVHNQLLDWRVSRWGKWRPSARALRLGPVAVEMDSLTTRDGLTKAEAVETLATRSTVESSHQQLQEMADQLPTRTPRPRFESCENCAILADQKDESPAPERRVIDSELSELHDRVESATREVLKSLDAEDRDIIRLRHIKGLSVAETARRLKLNQRRLYRRLAKVEATLRANLLEKGVTVDDAKRIFGWEKLDLNLQLEPSASDC